MNQRDDKIVKIRKITFRNGNCSVQELSEKLKIEKTLVDDAIKFLLNKGYLNEISNYENGHRCLGCGNCNKITVRGYTLSYKAKKILF